MLGRALAKGNLEGGEIAAASAESSAKGVEAGV